MLEGDAYTRILNMIGDGTESTTLTLATVVSPSPISVRVDGDSVDTPSQGIIVAEHLTQHKRTMRVAGGSFQEYEIQSNLNAGDRVIVAISNDGQLIYVIDKAVI